MQPPFFSEKEEKQKLAEDEEMVRSSHEFVWIILVN